MADDDRTQLLTDLLLGAAHADGELHGHEEAAVRKLLGKLLGVETLPAEVEARIAGFDPKRFDLAATAAPFAGDSPARKRHLLELVAAIGDADEVTDFAEDAYLRDVAAALKAPREAWADLVVELEELREALADVRRPQPPPVPEAARKG